MSITLKKTKLSWSARFQKPICLKDGSELVTLRDAAQHILKKKPKPGSPWLHAGELVVSAAEKDAQYLHIARQAIMRALDE